MSWSSLYFSFRSMRPGYCILRRLTSYINSFSLLMRVSLLRGNTCKRCHLNPPPSLLSPRLQQSMIIACTSLVCLDSPHENDSAKKSFLADLRARSKLFQLLSARGSDHFDSAVVRDMSEDHVVGIPQGKLLGKKERAATGDEFYSFHKIPYAKPPLGELRFKAPQPGDGWDGVRDATQDCPVSPSTDFRNRKKYQDISDEDCLFMNVYCKHNPNSSGGKKYPVMVWIHGGAFEFGSGNRIMLGPDYFMQYDVVIASFNYRLGALGFLSLQTVECPGNFGLKDQQLALKWVKSNIAYFGGDPENISIFGLSAGGASVHYQTLCLANKGLFKRGVSQSGTALCKWAYANSPRQNAFALGKRMGCDTKDDKVLLDFLRKASAKDIVLNSQGLITETEGLALGEETLNVAFLPTAEPEHEGAFITKHPWMLVKEGKQLDVPFITGFCTQEMIFCITKSQKVPELNTIADIQRLLPKNIQFKDSEKAAAVAKRLKEFYFKDGVNLESYLNVLSDIYFNYGIYKAIKARKNCTSPTYLYLFNFEGEQSGLKETMDLCDAKGTYHCEDMLYFFKTVFTKMEKMKPGSRDYNFMMGFTKMWMSFVATGVPSPEGTKWTKTTPEGIEYLDIGEKYQMKNGLMRERLLLWDEIFTSCYDR